MRLIVKFSLGVVHGPEKSWALGGNFLGFHFLNSIKRFQNYDGKQNIKTDITTKESTKNAMRISQFSFYNKIQYRVNLVMQQQRNQRDTMTPEHNKLTDEIVQMQNDNPESQVITYTAPWNMFAMGFSNKSAYPFRLAIASFLPQIENSVQIIQINEQKRLEKKVTFSHNYPPTKLLFIPDQTNNRPDLLATSGQTLKIWEIKDNSSVEMKLNLKNDNEFCAPLTSFDWNPVDPNLIGTSSIDTTCTIWDIEKKSVFTQLIAHDKEVYDIHFANQRNTFASAGADGSIRQFDLRDLQHSSVLYETQKSRPILKLAWNRKVPGNYMLAFIEMQQNYVTLMDVRKPSVPLCKLRNHKDSVNAIAWAPQSAVHMCSVGDDCKAYIWDLTASMNKNSDQTPLLEYKADEQITNLAWSILQKEWLAICFMKQLQILRL